jgi:hypothetical protein
MLSAELQIVGPLSAARKTLAAEICNDNGQDLEEGIRQVLIT